MKIKLLCIGKENLEELQTALQEYISKVNNYTSLEIIAIPYIKKTNALSVEAQKREEGEQFLKKISPRDWVVLLDEKGKQQTSTEFAHFIQQRLNSGCKNVIFLIGGAYGFSEAIYQRAQCTLSLSKMTFPHKLARLIFMEQLYRAFSILKGEPYHHE